LIIISSPGCTAFIAARIEVKSATGPVLLFTEIAVAAALLRSSDRT